MVSPLLPGWHRSLKANASEIPNRAVDCEASPAAGLDTVHHLSSGNKLFAGTTAATLRADLIFNMDRSDTSLIIE
jgi:hypothetical protein